MNNHRFRKPLLISEIISLSAKPNADGSSYESSNNQSFKHEISQLYAKLNRIKLLSKAIKNITNSKIYPFIPKTFIMNNPEILAPRGEFSESAKRFGLSSADVYYFLVFIGFIDSEGRLSSRAIAAGFDNFDLFFSAYNDENDDEPLYSMEEVASELGISESELTGFCKDQGFIDAI
jgi:hypothetical protein